MPPAPENIPNLKRASAINAALLVAYLAIVAWLFHGQATAWPHEGSYALLGYLLLCPGIVFQAFNLTYMGVARRRLARRVLTRFATVPLGIVLAALLGNSATSLSQRGFEEAYAPFVGQVGAAPGAACGYVAKYFAIPSVADYNRRAGRTNPAAKLRHDGNRFVLSFMGGSMDIDGSTLYYDSGAKAWTRFHNNDQEKAAAFEKLSTGLAECVLRAQ